MALFRTDSVVVSYSAVEAAKAWWIATFDCKQVNIPKDWDNPLPSDIALSLPGHDAPTILLCDAGEAKSANADRSSSTPIIFSDKLKKAREHLSSRGVLCGPITDGGDAQFFELRDIEGHTIEICTEP
jgi:hypothetical protein